MARAMAKLQPCRPWRARASGYHILHGCAPFRLRISPESWDAGQGLQLAREGQLKWRTCENKVSA